MRFCNIIHSLNENKAESYQVYQVESLNILQRNLMKKDRKTHHFETRGFPTLLPRVNVTLDWKWDYMRSVIVD